MAAQRRRDTGPERALRSELHRMGLRFRVDSPPLPSARIRADVLFRRQEVAVFVHGCFWHGCPEHGTWPRTNAAWWREKIGCNVARDASSRELLEAAGWTVVEVWEHDDPHSAALEVRAQVRRATETVGRRDADAIAAAATRRRTQT
jgi:DNA mismatch endonuclease (patch repair protein)